MSETAPQLSLRDHNQIVFENIEGWVGDRVWMICDFIKQDQDRNNIAGDVAEIGVHHGKLFFLIAGIAGLESNLIAIDLFENQEKNIDQSGSGSKERFTDHLNSHFSNLAPRMRIHAKDSMDLSMSEISTVFPNKVRVFSVDGGHTVAHVVNDLSFAQEVLTGRGSILLDDFMGPVWPSVSEGFFKYMNYFNRRLAPYLIFQNKLFLTTFSEHASVLAALREYLDHAVGSEIHDGSWRYTELCGYKVLCHG
jgi:Methyltransferase domain